MTTENFDRWDNDGSKGPNNYDWAIGGIPFLSAASTEYPYLRESLDTNKQQINTSKEVGEQSLGNWWYRSQSSFDLGAGIVYTDTSKDDNISRRFFDSHGIDALDELSQVKLQNKMNQLNLEFSNGKLISYYVNGVAGIIYIGPSEQQVSYWNTLNEEGILIYCEPGNEENILDIDTDGKRFFVLTPTSIYSARIPDASFIPLSASITSITKEDSKTLTFQSINTFKVGDVVETYFPTSDGIGSGFNFIKTIIARTSTSFTIEYDLYFPHPENFTDLNGSVTKIYYYKVAEINRESESDTPISAESGKIKFVKDRLVIAIKKKDASYLLQSSINTIGKTHFETPISIQGADATYDKKGNLVGPKGIRFTFKPGFKWSLGMKILKVENSSFPEYNFDDTKYISNISPKGINNIFRVPETSLPKKITVNKKDIYPTDNSKAAKVYTEFANLPIEIYKTSSSSFVWTGITEGPQGIYCSGNSGDKSIILFSTINRVDNNQIPELQPPSVVAELPTGEVIQSITSYLSTYIIIGTNKGVRVALIDGRGSLIVGPLSIKSDNSVKALTASDEFVYASGGKTIDVNGNEFACIYKLNLSKPVQENSLIFSYQKFLFNGNTAYNSDKHIEGIVTLSNTNKILFSIGNDAIYIEDDSIKVESGWIETGKIRLDTAEDKVFQYLRVTNSKDDGFISAYWRDEDGVLSSEYINRWYCAPTETLMLPTLTNSTGYKVLDMEGTSSTIGEISSHPYISYRFVLERGITNTNSPVLFGYQVKANPANIKQSIIRLPLLALQKEKTSTGLTITRPVYQRIKALEDAERNAKVILLQDFGTGEERYVIIEKIQFVSNFIPESKTSSDRGGIILLTVRTVK